MPRTIADKLPGVTMPYTSYQSSLSSGISVSDQSTRSDTSLGKFKLSKLRKIASEHQYEDGSNFEGKYVKHDSCVPRLPQIHAMYSGLNSQQNKDSMKCSYRLPASPNPQPHQETTLHVPRTVGKYRHRVKVIPLCSLPTPVPPQSPVIRLNAAHVLKIKEDYAQERFNNLLRENEVDMSKIVEQFSIARFLLSRDQKFDIKRKSSPTRSIGSKKSFPSTNEVYRTIENKDQEMEWISKLGAWVQPGKRRHIRYLKLCGGARITNKPQHLCSPNHDFYHHNLNTNTKDHTCPRYTYHHLHKPTVGNVSLISIPNKNKPKRKPLTIPKDPFTSKSQRQIKKPWITQQIKRKASPLPSTPVQQTVNFTLPSLDDDAFPPQWVVDNSTMTEDSMSDIYSITKSLLPSSRPSTPTTIASSYNYAPRLKRNNVVMVDKACEAALSGTPGSSRRQSICSQSTHASTIRKESSVSSPFNAGHGIEDNVTTVMEGVSFDNDEKSNEQDLFENKINLLEQDDVSKKPEKYDSIEEKNLQNSELDLQNAEATKETEILEDSNSVAEEHSSISDTIVTDGFDANSLSNDSYMAVIMSDSEESISVIKPIPIPPKKVPPPPKLLPKIIKRPPTSNDNPCVQNEVVREKVKKPVVIPPPKLLERPPSSKSSRSTKSGIVIHTPSPTPSQLSKKRRGKAIRDNALTEELRKARLAEERRKRAKEIFEKQKRLQQIPIAKSNVNMTDEIEEDSFLGKYCILNPQKMDLYRRTFDTMDIEEKGYLDAFEVLEGLQKVTPSNTLDDAHVNYIYRLLEMVGYNVINEKVNFKTFTILASLAQKISSLDNFVKGFAERFDFKSLDAKVFRAQQLFENYVETDHKMSKESLWLELQAGGITQQHEMEVRRTLKDMKNVDVLDFLIYLPLFVFTHQHIVSNPLCTERTV